jgi:hypothetical protein
MEMMRHSDLRLTMSVYTDANQLPVDEGFRCLPSFVASDSDSDTQIRTQTLDARSPDPSRTDTPPAKADGSQIIDAEAFWHPMTQIDANGDDARFGSRGRIRRCFPLV